MSELLEWVDGAMPRTWAVDLPAGWYTARTAARRRRREVLDYRTLASRVRVLGRPVGEERSQRRPFGRGGGATGSVAGSGALG